MKEIKDNTNRWREKSWPWIWRINIVKMTIVPKANYSSMHSLSNHQWQFSEVEHTHTKIHKHKRLLNSQNNLEKEEWSWRNQPYGPQTILQSYSNQDSMVLAQRKKYRSMDQDRKPRDKPTHLWTLYHWQWRQEYTMKKKQPFLDSYV